ncbi:hypothetical protein DM02DRAFT_660136 [Periconia macrospinosa]|uniref:Uncharacterized protein n=1 Tax=Periconia macrospinosa TaxID=97972 RepID=A0A2V1DBE3_9PLEO|nr:hypothetical protein DM02DRAFT_660136 [Periconia macrospinosa]
MQSYILFVVLGLLQSSTSAAPIDNINTRASSEFMLSNADGASVRRTAPELILPDAGLITESKDRRAAPELILPDAGLITGKKHHRSAPELILPDAGIKESLKTVRD